MLKHTVNNCMLQHYYAPCVNILPEDGYYYQVKNAGEQLAGNNYSCTYTYCTKDVQYKITIV